MLPFEEFKKLVDVKLRVFERRFLFKYNVLKPLIKFWPFFKRSIIRNIPNMHYKMEVENVPHKFIKIPYIVSSGYLGLFIDFVGFLLASLLIWIFPFIISDFIYDSFVFLCGSPIILLMIFLCFNIIILLLIPAKFIEGLRLFSIASSGSLFLYTLVLLGFLDLSSDEFQFQYFLELTYDSSFFNMYVGVDGFSLVLIVLTSLLFFLCFVLNYSSINYLIKEFNIVFHLLQLFVIFCLISLDIFFFYIFFEATLIPLFIIIGVWGTRDRKIYAAYKLFFYTLVSSLITLVGFVLLYVILSSSNVDYIISTVFELSFQKLVWFLLFLSFAVKIPMVPLHLWLPEAHVEAPTSGSVILAGVLLKLGCYGFIRFLLPCFPDATVFFNPLVTLFSVIAIIFASIVALRQLDLKKIIAYSSIAHMGLATLSLINFNELSLSGFMLLLVSHGLIAGALFVCVGVLYDRYKTKLLFYYKGLSSTMPLFCLFLFLFILGNIGLPGTSGFLSEFLILAGVFQISSFSVLLSVIGVIFSACYSLWLYNRVCFGLINTKYVTLYQDVTREEFYVLCVFLVPILFIGVLPNILLDFINFNVNSVLSLIFLKF